VNILRRLSLSLAVLAGGLASAVLIFGTLVPTLGFLRTVDNDRPSGLFTEASVDNVADFGAQSKSSGDTLIEVQVDGQGRMVDYYVPVGQMTGEIGNMLLFTRFTPATKFLQPATGKLSNPPTNRRLDRVMAPPLSDWCLQLLRTGAHKTKLVLYQIIVLFVVLRP
jgi:hypothetical protein